MEAEGTAMVFVLLGAAVGSHFPAVVEGERGAAVLGQERTENHCFRLIWAEEGRGQVAAVNCCFQEK